MNVNADLNPFPSSPKVAAVVVNWRQPAHTLAAVKALNVQSLRPLIIVVDNGSADDSADILARELPDNTLLVLRDTNGGFGAGCNAGIEKAISLDMDYIWLVNNDAQPEKQCLEKMVEIAFSDPLAGVVGARINDPSGAVPDHAGTVMNKFTFTCQYSLSEKELSLAKYAWITGAVMLLSASAIKRIGIFDQRFFMYWEDADLCARLKAGGFHFRIAKDAVVQHTAGTSSDKLRLQRFEWHIISQLLWVSKNFKFKKFGIAIIYARHIIKSILSMDFERLLMTMRKIT